MTHPEPRFFAFWSINAPLDADELGRQLERLRATGMDGVVFHPRFYPGDPPYLSDAYLDVVSRTILRARDLGMRFWLYDENGWPSGTAGGALLARYPEAAQQWVGLWREPRGDGIAEFVHDDTPWWAGRITGPGVDYLGPHLARRFQELTYERYRDGLDPAAWDHVDGFFCDEPEFGLGHAYDALPEAGAIPWTADLPDLYRARCDRDLLGDLPELFFDRPGSGDVRVRFWELLTDVFIERFVTPMSAWAERHGKRFAAHLKGEETPLFQVPLVGSAVRILPAVNLPAIDALERWPAGDYHPRLASTASRQWRDGRAMAEAGGGAGWGGTPGDLERFLGWLSDNGLTDFVMHISQYRLSSDAQDDWPPSQPLHVTWRDAYASVLDAARARARRAGRPDADVLLVAPVRAVMAAYLPRELVETNIHDGGRHPLTAAAALSDDFMSRLRGLTERGVNVDIVDERTAESAHELADGLSIGRARYGSVIVDPGCALATESRRMLDRHAWSAVSTLAPRVVADPDPAAAPGVLAQAQAPAWRVAADPVNALPLEPRADGDDWFEAGVDVPSGVELRLVFSDRVSELRANGACLAMTHGHDGSAAELDVDPGHVTVRFLLAEPTRSPRVRVEGVFGVAPTRGWTTAEGMLVTAGEWILTPPPGAVGELVADGYPFLRHPLEAEAEVELGRGGLLRFEGTELDAIGVSVDDRWCGWAWEREGEYVLPDVVEAGAHRIRALMIPNGFNAYGPHHYLYGDAPLISPDQLRGIRGFADPPDAPAVTHDDAWRFRRTRLPTAISVIAPGS